MFSVIFVLGLLYHTYTDLKFMLLYDKVTLFFNCSRCCTCIL